VGLAVTGAGIFLPFNSRASLFAARRVFGNNHPGPFRTAFAAVTTFQSNKHSARIDESQEAAEM
jgi:hypothetical protein